MHDVFASLKRYCEKEDYQGWDPYDCLNSSLYQASGLQRSALVRLILIQFGKRSPINFRPLLGVPKAHNPKALGLFLNGYCNIYRLVKQNPGFPAAISIGDTPITEGQIEERINYVAKLLIESRTPGYSGSCWGYNFAWQARDHFCFPAYTPTVVATTFCATSLFHAYEITKNGEYLACALSSADFVHKDLRRTDYKGGCILSYSPLPGNDTVFNASLLGAKLLSYCYKYGADSLHKELAKSLVHAACMAQGPDGEWMYGLHPVQGWIDSFHTGYNLDAIGNYSALCGDSDYEGYLRRGLDFYINNFFLADGTPKYYHDKIYPIDVHCPGQLWVTLSTLNEWSRHRDLAHKVADWTIHNLYDKRGYFYYQAHRFWTIKIPYMRWSNAFMFNALSYFLLEEHGLHFY